MEGGEVLEGLEGLPSAEEQLALYEAQEEAAQAAEEATMAAAFADCFAAGWDRVLLAGSDLPGLDSATFRAAAECLEQCGAVLLPTRDGGYGLFGLRAAAFSPHFFTDIAWSTDRVLAATLLRLQQARVRVQLLPVQGDIDTINDLRSYCRQPATHAGHTNAVLRVLGPSGRGRSCAGS